MDDEEKRELETKVTDLISNRKVNSKVVDYASHLLVKQTLLEILDPEMTVDQLQDIVKNKKGPLRVSLAMSVLKTIKDGNIRGISEIFDILLTPVAIKKAKLQLFD